MTAQQIARDYLREAYRQAALSPDPSNQVGAVLVNSVGRIVGQGYNHLPGGVTCDLTNRDQKINKIQHAERDAIFSAWGEAFPLVMYAPWAACNYCAQDIISCKVITKLVVHQQRMDLTPERWVESIKYAHQMLADAGIEVQFWSGNVGGVRPILVDGKGWLP